MWLTAALYQRYDFNQLWLAIERGTPLSPMVATIEGYNVSNPWCYAKELLNGGGLLMVSDALGLGLGLQNQVGVSTGA